MNESRDECVQLFILYGLGKFKKRPSRSADSSFWESEIFIDFLKFITFFLFIMVGVIYYTKKMHGRECLYYQL